jgi:AraC family transcriptional regulator
VFRQVTNIPPGGEVLSALRLERVKKLLLTTDVSVGEICFDVGYNSLGRLTTRFTRLVVLSSYSSRRG